MARGAAGGAGGPQGQGEFLVSPFAILPMELQVDDRFTDGAGEREVTARDLFAVSFADLFVPENQVANFDPRRVAGNPKWQLAPATMVWQGRSLAQICERVKDPARNGGHSLTEIDDHMAKGELFGWAWRPGADRGSAPGPS